MIFACRMECKASTTGIKMSPTLPQFSQPRIIRCRSNFVWSLNVWHSKCCKSPISKGQRSRSQSVHKFAKLSAGNCSISLKFRTNCYHVTFDVPRGQRVNGQGHSVKYIWWPSTARLHAEHGGLIKKEKKDSSLVKLKAFPTNVGLPKKVAIANSDALQLEAAWSRATHLLILGLVKKPTNSTSLWMKFTRSA